jgi:hypothetical protein
MRSESKGLMLAMPLDDGTRRVLEDGYRAVYDRDGALAAWLGQWAPGPSLQRSE